jgi:hypothetical protein
MTMIILPVYFIFRDAVLFALNGTPGHGLERALPGLRRPVQAWQGAKNGALGAAIAGPNAP